jgi:hypothetical protein
MVYFISNFSGLSGLRFYFFRDPFNKSEAIQNCVSMISMVKTKNIEIINCTQWGKYFNVTEWFNFSVDKDRLYDKPPQQTKNHAGNDGAGYREPVS